MSRTPGDRKPNGAARLKNFKKPFWIPVRGSSMEPTLRDGDLVRIRPLEQSAAAKLKNGEAVLFVRGTPPEPIVHRVVRVKNGVLTEKGDHCRRTGRVSLEEVVGVVTHKRRNGRTKSISNTTRLRAYLHHALSSFHRKPKTPDPVIENALRLLSGKAPGSRIFSEKTLEELLLHHELGALASLRIDAGGEWGDVFSDRARDNFRVAARDARMRRKLVIGALKDALRVLENRDYLLFKGLAAAEHYPANYVRNPGDLDLLLSPGVFDSIVEDFHRAGWVPLKTVHGHRSKEVAAKFGFAKVLRHPSRPVIVDLHRAPVDRTEPFWIEAGPLLERRVKVRLREGPEVNVPDPVDHLLLLALHSVRHGFFRLTWSLDVFFTAAAFDGRLDDVTFRRRCREWGVTRAVRVGLEISSRLFGPMRHPFADLPMDPWTTWAVKRRSDEVIVRGQLTRKRGWRRVTAMADLVEGVRPTFGYLARTAFPPAELIDEVGGWKHGARLRHGLRTAKRLIHETD